MNSHQTSIGSSAPIGVFDSGVGGLSVLHDIRDLLQHEDLLYVADSGHAPYGDKTPEFIAARSVAITRFLIAQGAKAIVVACNTATSAAVTTLLKIWNTVYRNLSKSLLNLRDMGEVRYTY